jgi:hypothetical protein
MNYPSHDQNDEMEYQITVEEPPTDEIISFEHHSTMPIQNDSRYQHNASDGPSFISSSDSMSPTSSSSDFSPLREVPIFSLKSDREGPSIMNSDLLRSPGALHPGFGLVDHERGRPRSLTAPSIWRSRSPSAASSISEGYLSLDDDHFRRSRASSVISDTSSIDPQLLSSPTSTTQSSSESNLYSSQNGSSSSFISPDPQAGFETPWNSQVATDKTKLASIRRRKKAARFFCHVLGCDQSFTAKHNLLNHLNSHRGARNFECPFCGNKFGTKTVLRRHLKNRHSS